MRRNKSGCCNHTHSKSSSCRRCGERPTAFGQFKFSGILTPGESDTSTTRYFADPGTSYDANADLQLYPLALDQDITTLSVNVPAAVPVGQKLKVEVLRDGAPLPTPLFVEYAAGEMGLKFAVTEGQTFNGASAPGGSSKLDVAATSTLVTAPGALVPVALTAVVG